MSTIVFSFKDPAAARRFLKYFVDHPERIVFRAVKEKDSYGTAYFCGDKSEKCEAVRYDKLVVVSVKIPKSLELCIESVARRHGMSKSDVLRIAASVACMVLAELKENKEEEKEGEEGKES